MTTLSPSPSIFQLVLAQASQFARAVVNITDSVSEIRSASVRAQRLLDMSDEQLAAKGLTRETIVSHAFEAYFSKSR